MNQPQFMSVAGYRLLRCLTADRALDQPQIYLAQNLTAKDSHQPVVVKFLIKGGLHELNNALPDLNPDINHAAQSVFLNEIQVMRSLNQYSSSYWLPLLDSGSVTLLSQCNAAYRADYIVMPYQASPSVKQKLHTSGFSTQQAWQLWQTILASVTALHQQGWMHLDLKLSNVLYSSLQQVYLIDFALTQRIDQPHWPSDLSFTRGTPRYMSPEQFLAQPLNPQTEFYALGLILYELLTGKSPYNATDYATWAQQHCQQPVPLLSADLTRFQRLIDGLLAKNRQYRLQHMAEIEQCILQLE